jgi:hypothetical protein
VISHTIFPLITSSHSHYLPTSLNPLSGFQTPLWLEFSSIED